MRRQRAIAWLAVLVLGGAGGISRGDEPASDSRARATWPGMTPAGTVLLPNGWSLRPAGKQSPLGDLPVVLALHPSEPIVAVLHAGYGEHEVVTVSTSTGRVIGRVALHQSFSGLVWSQDGKRLYAGGGFDDIIYGFDHAGGLLSNPVKLTFSERLPAAAGRGFRPDWRWRATAARSGSPTPSVIRSRGSIPWTRNKRARSRLAP